MIGVPVIKLWRGNSYTEIHGASSDLLVKLARNLAVQVQPVTAKRGHKFAYVFKATDANGEPTYWGTLLHKNRLPAGLTPHLKLLLAHYGERYELSDSRTRPDERLPLWCVRSVWRPYQDEAHKAAMLHGVGVIDAPPRSGKTLMMARAIDTLNVRTIVVAPSLAIVKQTYEVLTGIFGSEMVSRVDGTATEAERDISKQIVVATIASAIRLPQEYFDSIDLLAIDEFHHGAAESYHALNALAHRVYYRLCYTGTHFRSDPEDRMAMEAICSTILHKIPVRYLVDGGWLAPPRLVVSVPKSPRISSRAWDDVYDQGIVKNEKRNAQIAYIAKTLGLDNGIQTIVLVRRREHANLLGQMIPDSVVVKGGEDALTNQSIKSFRAGHIPIVIGTTVIGEGVDLPNAGAVIYASGGGGTVQQIQSYFRPLTGHPGKACGLIYDFKDTHHQTLSQHSNDRVALAEGCLDTSAVWLW